MPPALEHRSKFQGGGCIQHLTTALPPAAALPPGKGLGQHLPGVGAAGSRSLEAHLGGRGDVTPPCKTGPQPGGRAAGGDGRRGVSPPQGRRLPPRARRSPGEPQPRSAGGGRRRGLCLQPSSRARRQLGAVARGQRQRDGHPRGKGRESPDPRGRVGGSAHASRVILGEDVSVPRGWLGSEAMSLSRATQALVFPASGPALGGQPGHPRRCGFVTLL